MGALIITLVEEIQLRIKTWWANLSQRERSLLLALRTAFQNFLRDGITGTSASGMTYYFVFSIFPLSLLLTLLIGHFIDPVLAQEEVTNSLMLFLPHDAVALIHQNLNYVLRQNPGFSIMAILSVAWSSLGMLSEVTRVLDVIFDVPIPRTFIQQRLLASVMIVVLTILLFALFIVGAVLHLVSVLLLNHAWFWLTIAIRTLPIGMNIVIFGLTLHEIPNCHVRWSAVFPAAIVGSLGWETIRIGLGWYLGHATRYSLIYGSLSAIIILMLWVYAMALIFLLSAELCAQLNKWFDEFGDESLVDTLSDKSETVISYTTSLS